MDPRRGWNWEDWGTLGNSRGILPRRLWKHYSMRSPDLTPVDGAVFRKANADFFPHWIHGIDIFTHMDG